MLKLKTEASNHYCYAIGNLRMKTTLLCLIFLKVMSLGCTQTPSLASKSTGSSNKTNLGDLPSKSDEKNKPEVQQKLSSILYQLTNTSEPEPFAKQHGLSFFHDKVKVFIYFTPDAPRSEKDRVINAHDIQWEKQANDLASAWVPVDRLVALSKEPAIRFISPPKTLKKTDGKIDD
jgi:hypothetical protein